MKKRVFTPLPTTRFLYIDSLRGIAALFVVIFHLSEAVSEVSHPWLPPLIELIFSYGYLGVDIFFVISGFVIFYSVRNAIHTPSFLFRFGVRRSIRLDPPYWFTIILELLLIKLGLFLFPELTTPFPSIEKILFHFIYMQDIFRHGNIVAIFWTLCYEVQFYIVLVSSLVVLRFCHLKYGEKLARRLAYIGSIFLYVLSVFIFCNIIETSLHGLFIDRWFQFFLGFLSVRCVLRKKLDSSFVIASIFLIFCLLISETHSVANITIALTVSWLLVYAGLKDKMRSWLSNSINQFFGQISYSLYLIHPVMGWRFIKFINELYGEPFSPVLSWVALFAGVSLSIFSAWIMYKFIESKSLNVCHSIKMDRPLTVKSMKTAWRSRNTF